MNCKKCGKEINTTSSLCPECEAIAVVAADFNKARFYGLGGAIAALVCALLAAAFSVFAIIYSYATGAWLGYSIFTVVLMAIGFMSGGSAVVDYLERAHLQVKPFLTFVFGLASMAVSAISAIVLLVSFIFVSIIAFIVVLALILVVLGARVVLPIIRERRYVSVSEELAARHSAE